MDLIVRDLGGGCRYSETFELQKRVHAGRAAGGTPDTLLLLEHTPVYTLGTSAAENHVLLDEQQLSRQGIELVGTSRGGDVTYHGPGQLVGYPIVHLGDLGLRVLEYLEALEEVLIRVVAGYGISAGRDRRNRGVWVENSKLAAIGIRISRQVTMHGFALNVNTRLADYGGIVACGLAGAGVTSLERLVGAALDMERVKRDVAENFQEVFGYTACEWIQEKGGRDDDENISL